MVIGVGRCGWTHSNLFRLPSHPNTARQRGVVGAARKGGLARKVDRDVLGDLNSEATGDAAVCLIQAGYRRRNRKRECVGLRRGKRAGAADATFAFATLSALAITGADAGSSLSPCAASDCLSR